MHHCRCDLVNLLSLHDAQVQNKKVVVNAGQSCLLYTLRSHRFDLLAVGVVDLQRTGAVVGNLGRIGIEFSFAQGGHKAYVESLQLLQARRLFHGSIHDNRQRIGPAQCGDRAQHICHGYSLTVLAFDHLPVKGQVVLVAQKHDADLALAHSLLGLGILGIGRILADKPRVGNAEKKASKGAGVLLNQLG
ncbi:MAG: hypothetical protein BWY17_05230 [Deltaproteobacteria bacterium ADurb.Bin207]|nr:MAG: hypothetical protein BWY17_05230 [Deltaproteobacteria bacterium ADurb.Bin207]